MIKFFSLILTSIYFFCYSVITKEITIDIFFVSDAIDNKVMKFGNILTYRQTEGTATWKDSEGDYGLLKCMGNYVTTKKEGTVLNNYCQGTNRNKESFWLIMNRNSDEFEIGVGRITYIKGEGKFKEIIGTKCIYAVEISKEFSILKQKCKLNE